jgi:TatD DNase family protein
MVAPPAAPSAAPLPTLVDTHAHLNDRRFASDVDQIVQDALDSGVGAMVVVGFDLASSERAIALAGRYPCIWAAVGIHPHHANDVDEAALRTLEQLARRERVVAIGECGLDFYRNLSPRDRQLAAFDAQLALASRLDLPAIVHSREATPQTYDVLSRRTPLVGGVMHCFDGTACDAMRAVDLGLFVSCAGPITYRKDPTLATAIAAVPADRLVVETDCPWLSPAGHRGERNTPANVRLVAEAVARVRHVSLDQLAEQTTRNAAALFRTPALVAAALGVAA